MNTPQTRMTPRAAERMADIEPFHVMQLIARARELEAQGRVIVNMVVGEPDFPLAPAIQAAAMRVLEQGRLSYTPALGITSLREAIARWYRTRYGIEVPAARVAVTTGSSGALLITMGVLLDPGDQVMLADPGYPCNRHLVRARDGMLISDEIYHGLTYGESAHTALENGDDVFVINSFSKYFGMTGLR